MLVQDNRAQLLVSPGLQNNNANQLSVVSNPLTEQGFNSERDPLVSSYLVEQAAAGLEPPSVNSTSTSAASDVLRALMNLPGMGYRALHGAPERAAREQWAHEISQRLSSWVIRGSNLIEIEFVSRGRRPASEFLNRLLEHYLDFQAGLTNGHQAMRFFPNAGAVVARAIASLRREAARSRVADRNNGRR